MIAERESNLLIAMRYLVYHALKTFFFAPTKILLPNLAFVTIKTLLDNSIFYSWINFPNCSYQSLHPLELGFYLS